MAAATEPVDHLIREYLLYRGLTSTLRYFDAELKNDKDKGFRVDKIVDQIQNHISSHDFQSLKDYWTHLNTHLFSRLEQRYAPNVKKMEIGLYKLFVVYATINNKTDRVHEFFEKMGVELQNQPEFKEWFAFPFIPNPQDNAVYAMFFTRQWMDTYLLSLHNFLSVVFQAMPLPTLLNFHHDFRKMKMLQEENDMLKKKLISIGEKAEVDRRKAETNSSKLLDVRPPSDLVYDFTALSGDDTPEKQPKSTRRFPLNLSSPLLSKKKESAQQPQQKTEPAPPKMRVKTAQSVTVAGLSKPTLSRPLSQPIPSQASGSQVTPSVQQPATADINVPRPRLVSNHEKQRRELAGTTADNRKIPEKKAAREPEAIVTRDLSSVTSMSVTGVKLERGAEPAGGGERELSALPPPSPSPSHSPRPEPGQAQVPTPPPPADTPASNPLPVQIPDGECPFLLLSQEEYGEHTSAISHCRFSITGHYVASLDVDGIVKVWTWSPQPATTATIMSKSPFLSLAWASTSDRWLLLGNRSGNIRLFDARENKTFREVVADQSFPRVTNITVNPMGTGFVCSATVQRLRSLPAGDGNSPAKPGKLMLWDLRQMKLEKHLTMEPSPVAVSCTCYNHNGQLLLTGAADGCIRLYDMHQTKCISQWRAHSGDVMALQFSGDELSCFSMGSDGKFCQWSVNMGGSLQQEFALHPGASLPFLASSPTGSKEIPRGQLFALDAEASFVLTCDKNKAIVYQILEGGLRGLARTMEIKGHKNSLTTVDWSPSLDTRVCLTGSMDGKIRTSTLLSR